jgi:hypothetical protein
MKKGLSFSCGLLLFAHAIMANPVPHAQNTAPRRYTKASLRFSTYASYSKYQSIKAFKGADSANAFYRREFKKAADDFTDPWLLLTGGTLTGALTGTTGSFSGNLTASTIYATSDIQSTGQLLFAGGLYGIRSTSSRINFNGGSADPLGYDFIQASGTSAIDVHINGNTSSDWPALKVSNAGSSGFGALFDIASTSYAQYIVDFRSNNISRFIITGDGAIAASAAATFGGNVTASNIQSGGQLLFAGGLYGIRNTSSRINFNGGSADPLGYDFIQASGTSAIDVHINGNTSSDWPALKVSNAGSGGYGALFDIASTSSSKYIADFRSNNISRLVINGDGSIVASASASFTGNVGIGTTSPSQKLSVEGNISANGFITAKKVTVTQLGWSDYVFNKEYKLRSLKSLEGYINQYKHLPEVPTAKEVESKGISVGDSQALLLKKIEELTLYVIALDKDNKQQKTINRTLLKEIQHLKNKK